MFADGCERYQGVTLRRTGRKEDGVATFVSTEHFDIVASHEVRFSDAGDRVALVVLLRSRKVRTPCCLLMCVRVLVCVCDG